MLTQKYLLLLLLPISLILRLVKLHTWKFVLNDLKGKENIQSK